MAVPANDPLAVGPHHFEVDGVVQRYHVHGAGPVCIAHSGGPGILWEYLRMPALEQHLTVVYPEPVGSGASGRLPTHPHGYTRSRYSHFLEVLVDHLGVPQVHLLGHSHGGFVVQYYALNHPEKIAGVILYDSAPLNGPAHDAETRHRFEQFTARNADRPELDAILETFRARSERSTDEHATAFARGMFPVYFADYWSREKEFAPLRSSVDVTRISGLDENQEWQSFDDRESLNSLSAPTLVVVGRHDFICGVRWAQELHESIPDSELLILESSGHFGHLEETERFTQAVAGFVAATVPASA
ncbi:alpha/beta hydrolase [Actinacidiphila glaucinigra]|uniref:alpha/beta fold hydrolase n=1 Tax=Actinacidiphila glaucinigra TaxID=235986 RepID=UPI002DDB5E4A|nr:alpha/beta hydrolase [Actinacidiphila glaucinigra]WSD57730.1 alpha/beta hydrolase [Actinacidiphila glaucinigra]